MSEEIKPCQFCGNSGAIKSGEDDEIYHLDPNDDYWNRIRQDYHGNVQVDINDSKYPDARPGDSTTAVFWFNYCPECGQKFE